MSNANQTHFLSGKLASRCKVNVFLFFLSFVMAFALSGIRPVLGQESPERTEMRDSTLFLNGSRKEQKIDPKKQAQVIPELHFELEARKATDRKAKDAPQAPKETKVISENATQGSEDDAKKQDERGVFTRGSSNTLVPSYWNKKLNEELDSTDLPHNPGQSGTMRSTIAERYVQNLNESREESDLSVNYRYLAIAGTSDASNTSLAQATGKEGGLQPPDGVEQTGGDGGAQGQALSEEELAEKANLAASNPLGGNFFVILNQWNFDFLQGDITTKTRNVFAHIIQPVVPIPVKFLCEYCIWVHRPTFPFIYSASLPQGIDVNFPPGGGISPPPGPLPPPGLIDFGSTGGVGDIIYFSLVGISKPTHFNAIGDEGALVLAPGITSIWPTGSNTFSQNQYQVGPAAVASWIGKKYIFGVLAQHWWSYAERNRGDPSKVSQSLIQYFYFLNFPGAWSVGGSPQIEVDWEADRSADKLQFPIGLGVFKVILIPLGGEKKLPIKLGVEAQYYVAQNDTYGNEWRIQFTFAPIIPAPWADLSGM